MLRITGISTDFHIGLYRYLVNYSSTSYTQLRSAASQEYMVEANRKNVDNTVDHGSNEIKSLLAKVRDTPTLLDIVTTAKKNKATYAFLALDILATWSLEGKVNYAIDIEKDENFSGFVSIVEKFANYKGVPDIIKAIENLKQMGVKSDSFLIETLENDLLWLIRRVNISLLLQILSFQSNFLETDKQKKVLETTIDSIERRWTEVGSAHNFIKIYEHSKYFKPNFLGHIDDRVAETTENMNILDLSKVFCAINLSKRRPTSVLRALTFHMFKNNNWLSVKQTGNLIYAMNSLNYSDQALLDKLAIDLNPQVKYINQSNIIGSLLLGIGRLRWRNKMLMDTIGDWILDNINDCRVNDIANFIITMATVSYMPPTIHESFEKILLKIDRSLIPDTANWVNIVWSLIVLGKADNNHISSILSQNVSSVVEVDDPSNVGVHLKLLNINAYAKVILDSYHGPTINVSAPDNLLITQSRKDRSLQCHVQKILHNFLPPPKYIKENIKTTMGFVVDAEIAIDVLNRPIPLIGYVSNFDGENPSNLPNGAKRVAIMVWNYKDYTIGSQALTGFNPVIVKILQKLGYNVVQIPYFDVNEKEKIVKSVIYFQKRINEINTNPIL